MHAFRLDTRRAALVMPFGSGHAGGEQFARALSNERFVFAMRGDDHAEFVRQFQRPVKLRVIDPEGALVSEEDFERTDPACDDLAQLRFSPLVELRHAHVEGEIARAFPDGLRQPQLEPGERFVLARRTAHLDERRRSTNQRGLAAGLVGVFRIRAHERQVDVDVRIDEPWKDELARGVDHLGVRRRVEGAANARDRFVFAKYVAGEVGVSRDDAAVFDQE